MITVPKIAKLDLSLESGKISALLAEVARLDLAIAAAEVRRDEIVAILSTNEGRPDGRSVSDALLNGDAPTVAAASALGADRLGAERASLNAGVRDLLARRDEAVRQIEQMQSDAKSRVGAAVRPVAEAVMASLRQSAAQLVEGYSIIVALEDLGRGLGSDLFAAKQAVEGVVGMDKLLPHCKPVPVPAYLAEALRALDGNEPAFSLNIRSAVPIH